MYALVCFHHKLFFEPEVQLQFENYVNLKLHINFSLFDVIATSMLYLSSYIAKARILDDIG